MTKSRDTQVAKYGGEEGYRQHMREVRAQVTNHPGGSFRDKELARRAQKLSTKAKLEKKQIMEAHGGHEDIPSRQGL